MLRVKFLMALTLLVFTSTCNSLVKTKSVRAIRNLTRRKSFVSTKVQKEKQFFAYLDNDNTSARVLKHSINFKISVFETKFLARLSFYYALLEQKKILAAVWSISVVGWGDSKLQSEYIILLQFLNFYPLP